MMPALDLDAQRERRHVEQHDVLHALFLVEDGALHRGALSATASSGLTLLFGLLAEELLHELLHGREYASSRRPG